MTFRILTVCTGNICRSPLMEQLLRQELADVDAALSSAGTSALVDSPMDERAAAYSLELGGDPAGHRARQLDVETLREADLILVASREHRRAVVELLPRAARTAFTLREFARLLETLNSEDRAEVSAQNRPDDRLATVVDLAASNRGVAELPEDPSDDDVIDPFRRSDDVYAESVAQLLPAVRSIGPVLRRASTGFA
jgi:protein-tyrosine phosphatase